MRTCVFAGTFDPMTNGHAYIVEKCLQLFDKTVVAVGVNVEKNPLFSDDERVKMLETLYEGDSRVEVRRFGGMLVDFMKENGIKINVRGLRDADDYKYETNMARYNLDMYADLITVYIPTPPNLVHVSSSAMRDLIALKSDFSAYVPEKIYREAAEILKRRK